MIIESESEGLFVGGWPPLVDRGVVLPEFADPGALPAAARFGAGRGRVDQEWEVAARVGRDGFTVAQKGAAGGQFVGDELVIGRALQREKGQQETAAQPPAKQGHGRHRRGAERRWWGVGAKPPGGGRGGRD